jgi:hypothetical protein
MLFDRARLPEDNGRRLRRFRTQVNQDPLDGLGILDAGDDSHRPAAGWAGLDVDAKDRFRTSRLRP